MTPRGDERVEEREVEGRDGRRERRRGDGWGGKRGGEGKGQMIGEGREREGEEREQRGGREGEKESWGERKKKQLGGMGRGGGRVDLMKAEGRGEKKEDTKKEEKDFPSVQERLCSFSDCSSCSQTFFFLPRRDLSSLAQHKDTMQSWSPLEDGEMWYANRSSIALLVNVYPTSETRNFWSETKGKVRERKEEIKIYIYLHGDQKQAMIKGNLFRKLPFRVSKEE